LLFLLFPMLLYVGICASNFYLRMRYLKCSLFFFSYMLLNVFIFCIFLYVVARHCVLIFRISLVGTLIHPSLTPLPHVTNCVVRFISLFVFHYMMFDVFWFLIYRIHGCAFLYFIICYSTVFFIYFSILYCMIFLFCILSYTAVRFSCCLFFLFSVERFYSFIFVYDVERFFDFIILLCDIVIFCVFLFRYAV